MDLRTLHSVPCGTVADISSVVKDFLHGRPCLMNVESSIAQRSLISAACHANGVK